MNNTTIPSATDFQQIPSVKDYFLLMKPRVMSLVIFTALCGMILAPGTIHPVIAFTAILSLAMGAGASAAINMWYDRDIDALMKRTQKRPIVTGKVHADEALAFGIILAVIAIVIMGLCVNLISAILLAITILYYIFIYTMWLKRTSIQNVVIGGVAGALPPVIGWSAVTGNISLDSLALFAIIFIWTPPHSWALALFRLDDYRNCKVPMMPVIKGRKYTAKQIIIYSILMVIISTTPYFLGICGMDYLIISLIMGGIFLYYSFILFGNNDNHHAKRLFFFSILYLFIIFFSLIISHQLQ